MQHQYVADVGDYIKLALLRKIQPNHRIGVVWWLFPNEIEKGDGRHVTYLEQGEWRSYDPPLFDELRQIVGSGRREIDALQKENILPGATYFADPIAAGANNRAVWLSEAVKRVENCNLVFLDPDNGLEPRTFSPGRMAAGKSVAYDELSAFAREGRTVVVYHHQTRAKGGHIEEIKNLSARLGERFERVDAVRAQPYSPRVFFLLNATPKIIERTEDLCETWRGKLTFNPHLA